MANEMRDRLVELMVEADAHDGYECQLCTDDHSCYRCYFTKLADHLIENGVIVPPCKVGDIVYLIPTYNGKPYCGIREDKVQMIGITSRGIHIKARNHHDHNKMYMLGKIVFLTKPEAEQKLKEMRGVE